MVINVCKQDEGCTAKNKHGISKVMVTEKFSNCTLEMLMGRQML